MPNEITSKVKARRASYSNSQQNRRKDRKTLGWVVLGDVWVHPETRDKLSTLKEDLGCNDRGELIDIILNDKQIYKAIEELNSAKQKKILAKLKENRENKLLEK